MTGPDKITNANRGWFPKGATGNPAGRPRKSSRGPETSVFAILLDRTLTVTKGGQTREISMEEALRQRTFKDALDGKRTAMREVVKWIIKREAWFAKNAPSPARQMEPFLTSPDPDNADEALVLLGIAAHNPNRADWSMKRAQLLLEPWAVQLALRRKGGADLTDNDRNNIRRGTRDADTLVWPGDRRR